MTQMHLIKRMTGIVIFLCLMLSLSSAFAQTKKLRQDPVRLDASGPSAASRKVEFGDLPTQPLSLEKAIDYGLDHNRSLKAFQEEVMAVGQQVKQARAEFFPKLDTSYTFTKIKDQPFVTLGISGIPGLPSQFPSTISTVNHWELDVTQPIFTGFNLTAQLNISKMDFRIAQYRLESARLDLIRNIKYAFLRTLLGEKLLQVARDNVKALEVQQQNAEAYYQQGLTPRNDVLKANVALAEAVQTERAAAKQLITLKSQLNQLLDIDIQTQIALQDKEASIQPVPGLQELYSLAERQRPELIAVDTSVLQAEEGVRAARSGYYPRIFAFGQYYREGEDFLAETNPFTNEHNASVGVQVEWNWFEGGKTEAAAKEFKYRKRSLQEQRRDLEKQIKVQVEDAYEQLNVAKANIHTAETALTQARENERMTSLQYQEQLVIFLEVLNARVFVLESSVNYYQALYGYQMARADLERSIGGRFK